VRLNLPRFTLIGATTRSGLLTAPLLTRFPMRERLIITLLKIGENYCSLCAPLESRD